MKIYYRPFLLVILGWITTADLFAQLIRIPDPNVTNIKSSVGRTVGVTDIHITYNSPACRTWPRRQYLGHSRSSVWIHRTWFWIRYGITLEGWCQ